ncbi:MAG TPA: hypothetical protein VK171_04890 [Fimbriimonas sp.]|nr:hypothetical protein [Fimbriimonas sp.]
MTRLFLVAPVALALVSCSRSISAEQSGLVGKWQKSKGDYTVVFTDRNEFKYEGTLSEPPLSYQFALSGTFSTDGGSITYMMTDYKIDESRLSGFAKDNYAQIQQGFEELMSEPQGASIFRNGDKMTLTGTGITGDYVRVTN